VPWLKNRQEIYHFFIQNGIILLVVVIIIMRELLITSIRLMALSHNEVLEAGMGGKHKTASQMLSIFVILIFIMIKRQPLFQPTCRIKLNMII